MAEGSAPRALTLALVLTVAACAGSRSRTPRPPETPASNLDGGVSPRPPEDAAPLPSLDALAARFAPELPMMREVRRAEDASSPAELTAKDADTCFRAAVAAPGPVRVWFEGSPAKGDRDEGPRVRRSETTVRPPRAPGEPGASKKEPAVGLVPARGPVCVRKGEALRLVIEPLSAPSPGAQAVAPRAVIWQSP